VEADGKLIQKNIEVNATSVEFVRNIIDEQGEPTSLIDFGLMYFGEVREKEFYLVNNTPEILKYNCQIRIGNKKNLVGLEILSNKAILE